MSERVTEVRVRDPEGRHHITGIQLWGRKSRAEAIAEWRRLHERHKAESEAALALSDDDLMVVTAIGPIVMRNEQEVTE